MSASYYTLLTYPKNLLIKKILSSRYMTHRLPYAHRETVKIFFHQQSPTIPLSTAVNILIRYAFHVCVCQHEVKVSTE
jgi:hypothetical protein